VKIRVICVIRVLLGQPHKNHSTSSENKNDFFASLQTLRLRVKHEKAQALN
jgi:hypothetical protein